MESLEVSLSLASIINNSSIYRTIQIIKLDFKQKFYHLYEELIENLLILNKILKTPNKLSLASSKSNFPDQNESSAPRHVENFKSVTSFTKPGETTKQLLLESNLSNFGRLKKFFFKDSIKNTNANDQLLVKLPFWKKQNEEGFNREKVIMAGQSFSNLESKTVDREDGSLSSRHKRLNKEVINFDKSLAAFEMMHSSRSLVRARSNMSGKGRESFKEKILLKLPSQEIQTSLLPNTPRRVQLEQSILFIVLIYLFKIILASVSVGGIL